MPKVNKRKKVASSEEEQSASASSSDSGPEDRNPPPKKEGAKPKKSEAAAASGPAKGVQQNQSQDDAEPSWLLDKQRTLKVRSWRGKTFIDIREYYEKDGKQLPGKKGISLNATQWGKLKSIIPEVDKALEEI